jgi:hypothetical protein
VADHEVFGAGLSPAKRRSLREISQNLENTALTVLTFSNQVKHISQEVDLEEKWAMPKDLKVRRCFP